MSTIDNEIRERVNAFAEELRALVRRAALEAVTEALHNGRAHAPAKRGRKATRAKKAAAPAKTPKALRAGARAPGEKRSPKQIAATVERLFGFVKSNPGLGIEAISKALSTPTKELTLPVKKLLAERRLTSKGHKRATRYFPGK